MRIFDTIIKPILMYGSDVWGAYLYNCKYNDSSMHYIC
jgi:hypothetical protein